jgi:rhodanese-related sulfurtransferase
MIMWLAVACAKDDTRPDEILSSRELSEHLRDKTPGFYLVDVRTALEYAGGHIPGASNISLDTLGNSPLTFDKQAFIVVYCRSGNRSRTARNMLLELGYERVVDFGGITNWQGPLREGDRP